MPVRSPWRLLRLGAGTGDPRPLGENLIRALLEQQAELDQLREHLLDRPRVKVDALLGESTGRRWIVQ